MAASLGWWLKCHGPAKKTARHGSAMRAVEFGNGNTPPFLGSQLVI
jgi:hypothetical protein